MQFVTNLFLNLTKEIFQMSINLKNVVSVLEAKWIGVENDIFIDHISIDSRSLQNGSQTLFFALTGVNNDAHYTLLN